MLGKIDRKIFDEVIYPHLGKRLDEVIVPPLTGVDTGAIESSLSRPTLCSLSLNLG